LKTDAPARARSGVGDHSAVDLVAAADHGFERRADSELVFIDLDPSRRALPAAERAPLRY